ncbi:MAG: glycosyltransferase family 2 protein [Nanoarchaeota archaeon]
MDVAIVIPAYNEERSIGAVVKGLRQKGYCDIIVVDDGSKDKTGRIAERAGALVLRHVINRGQGAALKTGIDYAVHVGANVIVTFDADGQHRVEDIPAMIAPVKKGLCDVTLGSRFLKKKSNVPFLKRLVLKGGILFNWLIYGVCLSDAHNGFRALSKKAAERIDITADKMEHASEILEELKKKHLKYREVPVTIRYTDYSLKKGQGPLRSIPLGFRMILRKFMRML